MQGAVRLGATTLLALALATACSAVPVPHAVAEPAVARLSVRCRNGSCDPVGVIWIVITVILLISVLSMLFWILSRRRREAAAMSTPAYSTAPEGLAGVVGSDAPPGAYPPKQDGKTAKSEAVHKVHPATYPQTTTPPGVKEVYQKPVSAQSPPMPMAPPVGGYGAPHPTDHSGQQTDKDGRRPEDQTPHPSPPLPPPASVPPHMYGSVVLASANDLSQAPSHVSGTPNTPTSLPVHAYGSVIDQSHIPPPNPR